MDNKIDISFILSIISILLVVIGINVVINILCIIISIISIVLAAIATKNKWSIGLSIFSILGSTIWILYNFIN